MFILCYSNQHASERVIPLLFYMADEADNPLNLWPKDWTFGTQRSLVAGKKKSVGNWALYALGMVRLYFILHVQMRRLVFCKASFPCLFMEGHCKNGKVIREILLASNVIVTGVIV